jgi:adenosylcobalamin-dependent ribonucleoside-triphosphate reductase
MDYAWHARQTAMNGEPGYMWLDNARAYGRMKDAPDWADREAVGGNPCLEQTLHNYELCTLVETFPSRHESLDEYMETLKIAYLYAKTVTLIPTHWAETNSVMARNRRIGLSQSGIIKAFGRHGRREMLRWCDRGYEFITGLDVQYSNWLGVPKSIKKTSVKPSGTISLLAGEPPGIHYPHSEYYIRRIRVGTTSPLVEAARIAGYKIEPAVGQEDNTVCIEFPIKEEFFVRSKDDVSIWEQVANAVAYQRYWADNQVSVTVTFKPEEKEDIQHVLELYEDSLKGISFLPIEEHGYVQAPYETITAEQYLEMVKGVRPVVFDGSEGDVIAPKFCDSDSCEL